MQLMIVENPSRNQIILLLKKKSTMTVAEIGNSLGVTPMAVRQHLMSLEKRGLVTYTPHKYGIGRPVFLYSLTEKALDVFPKSYGKFINDLLGIIEETEGKDKIRQILGLRNERLLKEKQRLLQEHTDMADRVRAFARHLNDEGHITELEESENNFRLTQFNCTLSGLIDRYSEACDYELELYADLLGPGIVREQCQSAGDPACVYVIQRK